MPPTIERKDFFDAPSEREGIEAVLIAQVFSKSSGRPELRATHFDSNLRKDLGDTPDSDC
jgi:hypothetical protein